jgi:hypothetical protein
LRIEAGPQVLDVWDRFERASLAGRGEFLRSHELREAETRLTWLDRHVRVG